MLIDKEQTVLDADTKQALMQNEKFCVRACFVSRKCAVFLFANREQVYMKQTHKKRII